MNSLHHNATLLVSRVVLCCALVFIAHCETSFAQAISPEARKHFAAARQAQDDNQFDRAAEEYTATIRLAPTLAGAYSNLGLIYYVEGNFNDSATALAKGLHLDPKLVGANLYLGIDYLKLNHPDKALPLLQHAVRLDPSNKDAQSWLGTAYWQAGRSRDALDQLRKADKAFPNDPDILFVLGEAYRKTADQEIQAVITHASGTAYAHQVFGDIYVDQHVLAKAAGHYQRALRIYPNAPRIHFELGEAALFAGHLDQAEAEYRKQLDITPASAAAKARLAELALLNAQIQGALKLFGEAVTLSPFETVSALQLPPPSPTPVKPSPARC
jgi:tetratricopeptide (TPR) repeat protein